MLLSVGERISCALAAMAIIDLGHEAISLTGSQAGIVTDTVHGKAKIVGGARAADPRGARRRTGSCSSPASRASRPTLDITTLGRGGSDTTAVALAAALGADACEIYTDVEGVYTADPRIVPEARKLQRSRYEEMLEMAASGAKVMAAALRRVRAKPRRHAARALDVHATRRERGSARRTNAMLEKAMISGVTHTLEETVYRVEGVVARAAVRRARRGERQRRHDRADRRREIVFSAPVEDRGDAAARARRARRRGGRRATTSAR